MKQRIASLLIATMFASSCATAPPQKSTKKAANVKEWVMEHNRAQRNALVWGVIGAALSGGVTAVTGGSREDIVRNALAGGVAGAGAGVALGQHQDRRFARARVLCFRQAPGPRLRRPRCRGAPGQLRSSPGLRRAHRRGLLHAAESKAR